LPISISEEIAEEYYRIKGYVVLRNIGFLDKKRSDSQPGNIDIDVLAFNSDELLIISCKRGSLTDQQVGEELLGFKLAEKFLRGNNPHSKSNYVDIISNRKVKYLYVAEYITKRNRQSFEENNVETLFTYALLDELVELIKEKSGKKLLEGFETKPIPRLLKLMIRHHKKMPRTLKILKEN
jgi:Holliday junction resolvase